MLCVEIVFGEACNEAKHFRNDIRQWSIIVYGTGGEESGESVFCFFLVAIKYDIAIFIGLVV